MLIVYWRESVTRVLGEACKAKYFIESVSLVLPASAAQLKANLSMLVSSVGVMDLFYICM